MKIVEVLSGINRKKFLKFPGKLYKNDPFYITPLESEIEAVFNPEKNSTFQRGEASRWILLDDDGNTIGRIAAFIDEVRRNAYEIPVGGLGYFEVINNKYGAKILFDTAIKWLTDRGIEAIDGPINFGENDNNWGLLVDGFLQPTFGMTYNMKYYKDFFEDYGFRNYYNQYSYLKNIKAVEAFPERFLRIAEWISKKPGYSFDHFRFSDAEKYVDDVVKVYNATWIEFKEDFTPLDPKILHDSLRKTKAFLDEDLIWFAYHNNEPIAFFMLYPDLNQILKHLKGKLDPISVMKFIYLKKTHRMTRIRAVAAGVLPSYQNSGVESAIFLQLYKVFKKKPWYAELELAWVGDFNYKMISIYEALGADKSKVHVTYRFLVNRSAEFKQYKDELPNLG